MSLEVITQQSTNLFLNDRISQGLALGLTFTPLSQVATGVALLSQIMLHVMKMTAIYNIGKEAVPNAHAFHIALHPVTQTLWQFVGGALSGASVIKAPDSALVPLSVSLLMTPIALQIVGLGAAARVQFMHNDARVRHKMMMGANIATLAGNTIALANQLRRLGTNPDEGLQQYALTVGERLEQVQRVREEL